MNDCEPYRHRLPSNILHAIWLFYRFLLSEQGIPELLQEHGGHLI